MAEEGNSTSWQEQMAGIVECPICAETFSNNRLLPCGHTFCLKCLEEHRKVSKPRGKSLICPVCRKEFIIPKGGLPALLKNYSVQQLIDAHHQQREDKDTTRCDICDSDKQTASVLYCLQCDQNLCVDCEKMHRKMKVSSHHHAVPVSKKEQLKEFADDSQCAEHPYFRVDLVCLDCNSLICWKCKCLEHHLHNSDEIDDMADRCKEQLRSNIKESENRMSLLCKLSVNLKDKETQQNEILEKERNSIAKITAELIRAIVTREDALLKQVTTVAQKNLKQLQPHKERLEKQMVELKQHTADMKQLCDYGKPLELFRRSNELYAKTAEFLSLEITSTETSLSCLPESEIRKQLLADKVEVQRQLSGHAPTARSGRNSSCPEAAASQLQMFLSERASTARSGRNSSCPEAAASQLQMLLSGRASTARTGRNSSCPEAAASQLQMSPYEVPSDAIPTVLPQSKEGQLSGQVPTPYSGRNSSSSESTAPQLEMSTYEDPSDAIPIVLPQNQEASLKTDTGAYSNSKSSPPLTARKPERMKFQSPRRPSNDYSNRSAATELHGQLSGQAPTPYSGRNSSSPAATAPQLEMSTYEVPSDAISTVLPQNQEALLSRKWSYGAHVTVSPANNIRPQVSTRPHTITSLPDLKETEKQSVSSTKKLAICVESESKSTKVLTPRKWSSDANANVSSTTNTHSQPLTSEPDLQNILVRNRSVNSTSNPANCVGGDSESTKDILMSMKMSSPYQFLEIGRFRAKELGIAVCGVTVLRQEVYIIQDRCSQIQVYDLTNFSFRSKINIEGLAQPNDLASCESYNCIYVVDWTERTIHRVEVEGDDKIVTKWHTGKEFGGISRSYDSNVILAGFLTGILMEYSTKGDLIREILLKPDIQEAIHPWHALKLPSGEFVVSHGNGRFGQHRVCLVDVVGNVINSFGGSKGSGTDKLFGPYHMALAINGDVFVADCNNCRVVRLNDKLKYQEEISMNVRRPRRLCFEPTSSKLLVASNDITDGNKASDGAIVILKAKSIYV